MQRYERYERLVCDLRLRRGVRVKVKALEADLFVQSVQMRNVSELDGLKH